MFNWSTNNKLNSTNPNSDQFTIEDLDVKNLKIEPDENTSEDTVGVRKINLSDPRTYAHYLQITPTEEENLQSIASSPEIIYSRSEEEKNISKNKGAKTINEKTASQNGLNVKPPAGSSPSSPFEEMLGDINSFGSHGPPGISSPSGDSGFAVMVGSTSSSFEDALSENGHVTNNGRPNATWMPPISQAEKEEWQKELDKIEDEIKTLRQVLQVKMRRSSELKRQLGLTPLQELQTTLKTIQESDAYQKTTTTLKTAGQKTGVVLTSAGTTVKSRIGDLKKSPSFQSFQERMNTTYNKIAGKSQRYSRMRTSQSEQNFGDIVGVGGVGGGRRPESLDVDDHFQSASVPTTPTL